MEKKNGYEFWKRIDKLRANSQYSSMKELSDNVELDYVRIKNQRSDNRIPKAEDVCKLSHALHTTAEFLVTGKSDDQLPSHIREIVNRLLVADSVDLEMIQRILKIEDDDNKKQQERRKIQ